ncbi:MAG: alpha/beta hydrolase [Fibrella sp.]|nr:alpha/beta hydrolase [Armatimonadota bacterium]
MMTETVLEATTDDGVKIAVRRFTGAASDTAPRRDVLLLHGWPNSSRIWQSLAETLIVAAAPAVSLHIFAPDLRGFGDSGKPATGYTCERFAQDVAEVTTALNLRDYLLVGHSMGGKIAQIVAAKNPSELSALALLTPGLLAPSPPVDVSARIASYGDAGKTRTMLAGWAMHPLSAKDEAMLTEDGLRTGRDAWNGWLETMRNEDFASLAAQIAVTTLVIGAAKDPQRTEEELQSGVVSQIAGSTYASIPMVGHLPHLEDPILLGSLLINFMDGLPEGVTQ